MKQPLLMPQQMQLTGGGTLTIVWYNGTAWTKLGGGSGWGYRFTPIVSNYQLMV
jgi:hypothetical protein